MSNRAPSSDRSPSTPPDGPVNGHYWVRARRSAAPFVIGALGLAALGVGQLVPIRHTAESDLRVRSLNALEQAGLTGITVDFTGQDGVLTGTVASSADARRALEIVRGLEGVRVATSRLAVPGPGDGGIAPAPTPSPAPPVAAPPVAAPPVAAPPVAVPPVASPSAPPSPSTPPSPATPPSPPAAPSVTVTPTAIPSAAPTPRPASTSLQAARAAVQAQLRALPSIGFASASAELTPAGRATVARAARVLTASPTLRIRVDGYTDDLGDWDMNLALSRGRAQAVRRALVANGVPAARVTAVGWSEEHPKVPNTSTKNRTINRRVEIVVH